MANDSRQASVATQKQSSFTRARPTPRLLRVITALGLGVDAYLHWHLAANFDTLIGAGTPHISQGQLFRFEAALALIRHFSPQIAVRTAFHAANNRAINTRQPSIAAGTRQPRAVNWCGSTCSTFWMRTSMPLQSRAIAN